MRSFFIQKALSLNEVLPNVSNLSVSKDFLFFTVWCCLLACIMQTQKKINIRVFCLLDRMILHSLSVRAASDLSMSQIPKSWMVFKSQYPLICSHRLDACKTHSVCVTTDFAWFPYIRQSCAVQYSHMSTHTEYHKKIEIHISAVWMINSCSM